MMIEYDWVGNWEAPGHGKYVIRENGKELEPGDVINRLYIKQDIQVQQMATVSLDEEELLAGIAYLQIGGWDEASDEALMNMEKELGE